MSGVAHAAGALHPLRRAAEESERAFPLYQSHAGHVIATVPVVGDPQYSVCTPAGVHVVVAGQ